MELKCYGNKKNYFDCENFHDSFMRVKNSYNRKNKKINNG